MSNGQPPQAHSPSTNGQRALIAAAILLFAALSVYLALIIITRVDSIFLPGNQITLSGLPGGGALDKAPGIDASGTSGSQERINILVLGLDRRPREGEDPTRTDTIFIVTVDPKTKSSAILGIPRDLVVDIPLKSGGTYKERINTVYVQGELEDYDGGGVGLMKQVIFDNFKDTAGKGITIDKWVMVDFDGFVEIIDALGGIDVDIPEYVYDPYYSWTELPGDYDPQEFEVGREHMDGRTALAYSRIRFSSDDLDRIQRQQRVIFATIEKAKTLNVLDAKRALDLWNKYNDAIKTDVDTSLIFGYAKLADDVKDHLEAVSIGPATAPYTGPQGQAFLDANWDEVARIVDALFDDASSGTPSPDAAPEPVRVQVQNGTATDGLAAQVVNFIAAKGYPINDLNPANVFDGASHDITEIIDLKGTNEKNRLQLAGILGIDPSRAREATPEERAAIGADADIVIIIGADFDLDRLTQAPATGAPGG